LRPRGSRRNSGTNASPELEPINLKVGDQFEARLDVTISSLVDTPVLASVEKAVEREGERVLRLGDRLRGRASSDGHRVFVRFNSVETSDGLRSISAVAHFHDADGLPAQQRESDGNRRTGGSVALAPRITQGEKESERTLEVSPGIVFDVIIVGDSRL
jgi:hypothetical protein